jgi:hypothetical protein
VNSFRRSFIPHPSSLLFFQLGCLALVGLASAAPVEGAGRARLELFADQRASITSQQAWLRELAAAGVSGLRIRIGQATDKVGVEVQGSDDNPTYLVTGMITAGDELVLPGRRFRIGEAPQVARWLTNLAEKGLKEEKEESQGAFGLRAEQFEKAQKDLAQPVASSTKGIDRSTVVRKIGEQLTAPLRVEGRLLESAEDDKVAEELSGISCGTALAYLLRPAGLGLVPRARGRDDVEYRVVASKQGVDVWPVGWPSEKPLPQLLPAMYESFNANIQDVPVTTVLEAIGKRLKLPFLLDHNALARHGIEPDKKKVNSPQSRTTSNQLLRKVLSQAGLKSEVRLDEAGKPFLWVTTIKPL